MKLFVLFLIFTLHPGFCQDEDLDEAQQLVHERNEKARLISLAQNAVPIPENFDLAEKIKTSSIFDKQVQDFLQNNLAQAKLWERKPEEVRQLVLEAVKGKPAEKVFNFSPKLLDVFTELLRDKEALPQLLKILNRKEALKQYSIIWLILVVGLWLIKKNFFPPEPNFFRGLITSVMFSVFFSCISLGLFYLFFREEISPTVKVLAQSFSI